MPTTTYAVKPKRRSIWPAVALAGSAGLAGAYGYDKLYNNGAWVKGISDAISPIWSGTKTKPIASRTIEPDYDVVINPDTNKPEGFSKDVTGVTPLIRQGIHDATAEQAFQSGHPYLARLKKFNDTPLPDGGLPYNMAPIGYWMGGTWVGGKLLSKTTAAERAAQNLVNNAKLGLVRSPPYAQTWAEMYKKRWIRDALPKIAPNFVKRAPAFITGQSALRTANAARAAGTAGLGQLAKAQYSSNAAGSLLGGAGMAYEAGTMASQPAMEDVYGDIQYNPETGDVEHNAWLTKYLKERSRLNPLLWPARFVNMFGSGAHQANQFIMPAAGFVGGAAGPLASFMGLSGATAFLGDPQQQLDAANQQTIFNSMANRYSDILLNEYRNAKMSGNAEAINNIRNRLAKIPEYYREQNPALNSLYSKATSQLLRK